MKWISRVISLIIIFIVCAVACYILAVALNSFVSGGFRFSFDLLLLLDRETGIYFSFFIVLTGLLYLMYYYKHYWLKSTRRMIKGHRKDSDIETNLESAKFQTDNDIAKNFERSTYEKLARKNISGIPIRAIQRKRGYHIDFAKSAHTLVIGTTGSGKTTAFINPTIQILAQSKAKSSMLISDPKGELYQLHAKTLKQRGYDVKILDLRNPFRSIRWNPLERPFLNYQKMLRLKDDAVVDEERGCYIFEGRDYYKIEEFEAEIKVRQQEMYDLVYEDLHDIAQVLCPITNKQEPIWESGAKNLTLGIMLAMLEDSENIELGMTKEKFNFYNVKAIATNTENECAQLLAYFRGRPLTSRAVSLARQSLDSADKTRGSYISTMFDKLNLFADLSLCGLTSENEIDFSEIAEKPTAVFLQVPDERETRHPLAAMVVLQAYKELVRKANSYTDLTLPRNVYFMLDEFGNLPLIPKMEQIITVGRSRKIWMVLVVQSYAQLVKVYDEKISEIIKSNCNIQAFIGSTDQKTIDEFSKRCGNFAVITRNVGYNTIKADDINSNASIKERPLIYPSELQQINSPTNMGNIIITVFGFNPIRSKFTPSFKCKAFNLELMEQKQLAGRFFNEEYIFYNIKERNKRYAPPLPQNPNQRRVDKTSPRHLRLQAEVIKGKAEPLMADLLDDEQIVELFESLDKCDFNQALQLVIEAHRRADLMRRDDVGDIKQLVDKLKHIANEITPVRSR